MSLFKNFNLARFKKIKPPGDKSITTYSDRRDKTDIVDSTDGLNIINAIKPR